MYGHHEELNLLLNALRLPCGLCWRMVLSVARENMHQSLLPPRPCLVEDHVDICKKMVPLFYQIEELDDQFNSHSSPQSVLRKLGLWSPSGADMSSRDQLTTLLLERDEGTWFLSRALVLYALS